MLNARRQPPRRVVRPPRRPGFTPAPLELRRRTNAPEEAAPPGSRRWAWASPRARRLAITALLAAVAVLVVTSAQRAERFKGATAAVQTLAADALAATSDAWARHVAQGAVVDALAALEAEHAALALEVARLREVEREHARLVALLDMAAAQDLSGVGGRVIARATSGRHTLRLDIGTERGVAVGQAVVSAQGVVGQVVDAGEGWTDVLTVTDPLHAVAAVVLGDTEVHGTAVGDRAAIRLDHVIGGTPVAVGAEVVTSGEGGVFPRGLPIGRVASVASDAGPFLVIEVTPAAAPTTLSEVLVLDGPIGVADR